MNTNIMTMQQARELLIRAGCATTIEESRWRDGGDDDPSEGVYVDTPTNKGPQATLVANGRPVGVFRITDAEYKANGNGLLTLALCSEMRPA